MLIGVTGSIGAGKTTVAKMLKRLGASVIDADKIAHKFLDKAARKKLAGFIFDDKKALGRLCGVIHPLVKEEIARKIRKKINARAIVIDAPLLIESGLYRKCDVIIVVKAGLKVQIGRASRNLSIPEHEVKKRIILQMPLRRKTEYADFVIDNSGSLKDTGSQVKEAWRKIRLRFLEKQACAPKKAGPKDRGEIWKK